MFVCILDCVSVLLRGHVEICVCVFKQKTAYEMRISDWSSDVCSSDLLHRLAARARGDARRTDSRSTDCGRPVRAQPRPARNRGRSVRSEEHTSELQSLKRISYAVFSLTKKTRDELYYIYLVTNRLAFNGRLVQFSDQSHGV